MSNKRNRRRSGQRIRGDRSKPTRFTKAMSTMRDAIPIERERKQRELDDKRFWAPILARSESDWRLGRGPRKRIRTKPRTSMKKWIPSHSLDN